MKTIFILCIFVAISLPTQWISQEAGAVSQTMTATIGFADSGGGYTEHEMHYPYPQFVHHLLKQKQHYKKGYRAKGFLHIGGGRHQSVDISINNFKSHNGIQISSIHCGALHSKQRNCNQPTRFLNENQYFIQLDAMLTHDTHINQKGVAYPKYDILVVYN